MKKFLSLLLCLVFVVTMLASCSEDVIGDYDYPNFVPKETPAITLDFYVFAGEGTSDLAKDTVERMLSQYTETKYKTSLVLHYIAEADYKAELLDGWSKAIKACKKNRIHWEPLYRESSLINYKDALKQLYK